MATPLTDSINALTTYANEVTGASDTTLSDAVHTLVDGYGQGGGGSGYTLLASGTYIQATNSNKMTIPVDYSGTPIAVFVEAQTFSSEGNQTYAWFWMDAIFSEASAMFPSINECRCANTNSVLTNRYISGAPTVVNSTSIVVTQYSASIPIRANTYNWYIWGIA